MCRPAAGLATFLGGFSPQQWRLTNDDSIVGSLVDGAVKLDDISVAEDAEDFSLTHKEKNVS